MDYKIVSKISLPSSGFKKIGEFRYYPEIDGIYYEGPYPFPVQLLIYEGLNKCQVTPAFLRLPFIMRGWINLDIVLREIDVMKHALQNRLLLHASCVGNTLIVGFPNSGKTYQTYKRTSEGGVLISEEYTILKMSDQGNVFAMPYKSKARSCLSARTIKDCGFTLSAREKVELALRTIRAKMMPFMFEAAIWREIPLPGVASKISKIEYGSTGLKVDSWKHLAILTDNEFPFTSDAFLQAYALTSGLDILDIQEKQRKLIKEFVYAIYHNSKSQ